MAAGFSIVIRATDSATKRIDDINRRLAAMRAPVDNLNKSLAAFSRLSGVGKVAKGFSRMARGALSAFQSIARVVAPLAAITGAASVAGMYRMVEAWSQWGSQLGFTSQRIGITAGQLQAFQGAGLLAGSSVQSVTTGLQALGQTMYDAIGGRAPETVALFNQLGIAFDDGTRHARSVAQVLPEIADKIAAIKDPYTQARVAAQLFGGAADDLLPFLRRGSAGIAELTERARAYGVMNQAGIDGANKMREAQAGVTLAMTGLGNAIAERVAPVIQPLLNQFAEWINKARTSKFVTQDLAEDLKGFATWVQNVDFKGFITDLKSAATTADTVAQAFGGWKRVVEGIIALKLAGWAASAAGPLISLLRLMALIPGSGVTGAALAAAGVSVAVEGAARGSSLAFSRGRGESKDQAASDYIAGQTGVVPTGPSGVSPFGSIGDWLFGKSGNKAADAAKYFSGAGWTKNQAAGIAANIQSESGFNPFALGDKGSAYGLGQWHADRQAQYAKRFGHTMQSVKDLETARREQMDFYNYELTQGNEQGAGRRLRGTQTPYEAGAVVSRYDERPAAADEAAMNRGQLADRIALADGAPGAPGAHGKVQVEIKTSGPGIQQVTARSSGNVNPPKIASTGVGAPAA